MGLIAGSLVRTPDAYQKIEELVSGDYVICFDSGKIVSRQVVAVVETPGSKVLKLVFSLLPCASSALAEAIGVEERLWVCCSEDQLANVNDVWLPASVLKTAELPAHLWKLPTFAPVLEVIPQPDASTYGLKILSDQLPPAEGDPRTGSGGLYLANGIWWASVS